MINVKECLKRQEKLRQALVLEENKEEDKKMCKDLIQMIQSMRQLKTISNKYF